MFSGSFPKRWNGSGYHRIVRRKIDPLRYSSRFTQQFAREIRKTFVLCWQRLRNEEVSGTLGCIPPEMIAHVLTYAGELTKIVLTYFNGPTPLQGGGWDLHSDSFSGLSGDIPLYLKRVLTSGNYPMAADVAFIQSPGDAANVVEDVIGTVDLKSYVFIQALPMGKRDTLAMPWLMSNLVNNWDLAVGKHGCVCMYVFGDTWLNFVNNEHLSSAAREQNAALLPFLGE